MKVLKSPYDYAKEIYSLLKFDYVCSSMKYDNWYKWDVHRWKQISPDIAKNALLSLPTINIPAIPDLYNEGDKGDQDDHGDNGNRLRERIFKECNSLFYNEKFINSLDADRYLLGFENGIYDFREKRFREGRPEDYVSLSTGFDYKFWINDTISSSDRVGVEGRVQSIKEYIHHILPDTKKVDTFFEVMGRILVGDRSYAIHSWNCNKEFINLISKCLGEYCFKFPSHMLKLSKLSKHLFCSSELANTFGKKLAIIFEESEDDAYNINDMALKPFIENHEILSKQLYRPPRAFEQTFQIIIIKKVQVVAPNNKLEVVEIGNDFSNDLAPILMSMIIRYITEVNMCRIFNAPPYKSFS
jgi:hypothetical protein